MTTCKRGVLCLGNIGRGSMMQIQMFGNDLLEQSRKSSCSMTVYDRIYRELTL